MKTITTLVLCAILSAAVAGTVGRYAVPAGESSGKETSYERVLRTGTLRCGYQYWDSGIMKDEKTGTLHGAWVDILNEFGRVAHLKVEWTSVVGWGEVGAALKSGKVDAMCAGMWQSTAKAREMAFSAPFMFQGFEAFARADDRRFDGNIDRINSDDVTILVIDGDNGDFVAQSDFPKAKRVALSQLNGTDAELFMGLASGKADITMSVTGLWRQFDINNPG